MSKFRQYKIDLFDLSDDIQTFTYQLDDEYFAKIDSSEIQKGSLEATVKAQKRASTYELSITLDGVVQVPCDRCLDNMSQEISCEDVIKVKLGETHAEDDDAVIIPETDGFINIAWFFYEYIILNIPIKHIHAKGKCNKGMMNKLKEHVVYSKDEENALLDIIDEENFETEGLSDEIDPRWKGLKDIKFENN